MGNGEKLLNGYNFAFGADEKLLELEKKKIKLLFKCFKKK